MCEKNITGIRGQDVQCLKKDYMWITSNSHWITDVREQVFITN